MADFTQPRVKCIYCTLTCVEADDHVGGLRAGGDVEVALGRVVVGEREAVEGLRDGLLDDLLEAVAVHPEVVGQALQLVRPELLQGVPLALGELKISICMSIRMPTQLVFSFAS